jgi:hypothetical protein
MSTSRLAPAVASSLQTRTSMDPFALPTTCELALESDGGSAGALDSLPLSSNDLSAVSAGLAVRARGVLGVVLGTMAGTSAMVYLTIPPSDGSRCFGRFVRKGAPADRICDYWLRR